MSTTAPITLFTYNRPDHVRLTVEALKRNELAVMSDLIVFSDGPKNEKALDKVAEVRKYLRTIKGFKSIEIIEHEKNQGLAGSIIAGVTKVVNEYEKIIVLEDDLVTSPHFLRFMNDGLKTYESAENVISIHGYSYPLSSKLPYCFFLNGADCWGWATWKRGWELFEPDGNKLLEILINNNLTYRFDYDGAAGYTQMLKDQIGGKNDSWAVRWYASAFILDKLTLYPGKSWVQNIGLDGSGVHRDESNLFNATLPTQYFGVPSIEPVHSDYAYNLFKKYIVYLKIISYFNKIINKLVFFKNR